MVMSQLHEAAMHGDVAEAKELLEKGSQGNKKDSDNNERTPLHCAVLGYKDSAERAASAASSSADGRLEQPAVSSTRDAVDWWVDLGDFMPYEPTTSAEIERAYQDGKSDVCIEAHGNFYFIDFATMRQIDARDDREWRGVRRVDPQGAAHTLDAPAELQAMCKKMGSIDGFHLTTEDAAASIMKGGFLPSQKGVPGRPDPMFGPFIYFATTLDDCQGKARSVGSLSEGALLKVCVNVGTVLHVTSPNVPSAVQAFLGITQWKDLDDAKMRLAGCDSVYAKAGGAVNRDEFCVRDNSQLTRVRLVNVYKPQNDQLVSVPWYQWSEWVNNLAHAVVVDEDAVDAVAELAVKTNSVGRPIHDNGKFMSYSEARQRGWSPDWPRAGAARECGSSTRLSSSGSGRSSNHAAPTPTPAPQRQSNPWNEFQHRNAGRGLSKTQLLEEYYGNIGRPSSSGSCRSSNDDAPSPTPAPQRQSNPWNEFQHRNAGRGLSKTQLLEEYHGNAGRPSSSGSGRSSNHAAPTPTPAPQRQSNLFRNANHGSLMTQLREEYYGNTGRPSSSGSDRSSNHAAPTPTPAPQRQSNPWNEFQRQMGGQGYSQKQLSEQYHSMSSGLGSLSWMAGNGGGFAESACYGLSMSSGLGGLSSMAGNGGGFAGSACYRVSSSPAGPLKADGTPDMRYKANRR